jgi:hypothetical protein
MPHRLHVTYYPRALYARVIVSAQRVTATDRPRAEVADALGLTPVTLARWGRAARVAAPGFRPVVGVRVEGLSVEQAAELCPDGRPLEVGLEHSEGLMPQDPFAVDTAEGEPLDAPNRCFGRQTSAKIALRWYPMCPP